MIDFQREGIFSKDNIIDKKGVVYMVLELCEGGELYDYVAMTGKFDEKIARHFFRQLINCLEYM
jgi:serine/threonine protein kinase